MKLRLLLTVFTILFIGNSIFAQSKKVETVVIQTSAQCSMCKERIEKELVYTKGVKKAELNLEDKKVTVTFQGKKITADGIRTVLSDLGYDADEVVSNKDAYASLPNCCKKPADRGSCTEMHE